MLELENKPEIDNNDLDDERRTSFRCAVHKAEEAAILLGHRQLAFVCRPDGREDRFNGRCERTGGFRLRDNGSREEKQEQEGGEHTHPPILR